MAPVSGELVPSAAIGPLRDDSMIGRPLDGARRGLRPARMKSGHRCDGSTTDRPPDDSKRDHPPREPTTDRPPDDSTSDRRVKGEIGVRRVTEIDLGIRPLVVRICLGIDPIICRRRWTERR